MDGLIKKQNRNGLHVYAINENEYIGAINMAALAVHQKTNLLLLLHSSESMGDEAARFVKDILPLVLSKMNCWEYDVNIFTFGKEGVHIRKQLCPTSDLIDIGSDSGGASSIGPAIKRLRTHLEKYGTTDAKSFDVLTISAGEICDQENAENETKKLIDFLATTPSRINSQAVRLFTTPNNDQTNVKALFNLLQMNNSTAATICDIDVSLSNEAIANEIAALFPEKHNYEETYVDKQIILKFPWKSILQSGIALYGGWNICWFKEVPITLTSCKKRFCIANNRELNLSTFQHFMEKILPHVVSHMKILKIVGTPEANKTVNDIFSYLAKTEDALAVQCSSPNDKIITNALAGIANFVADFRDSAEMIEFYRNPSKAIEAQERRKRDEEERGKRDEEERGKRDEEERRKRDEEERRKRDEEERLRQEEERLCNLAKQEQEQEEKQGKRVTSASKMGPNPDANLTQNVFILDERMSGGANKSERGVTETIVPLMVSKLFNESLELAHGVTLVRYKTTAAEMLQSLVKSLDATKRIQIWILTNRDDRQRQEMDNLAKTITDYLNESGFSFELQVVQLASTSPSTEPYKLIDIGAHESDDFIAERILESVYGTQRAAQAGISSFQSVIFFMIFALLFLRYISIL